MNRRPAEGVPDLGAQTAEMATLLAAALRYDGTLGNASLSPLAKTFWAKLRAA